jgi:hypothetical protein
MPCNGWNHSASCECGWGGMWHGNTPYGCNAVDGSQSDGNDALPIAVSIHRSLTAGNPQSLTIPNARCPVCRASVFFYQNEYGSRVFFDELGPPWPKHPCTDNTRYDSPASGRVFASTPITRERRPRWLMDGWRPALIARRHEQRVILKAYDSDEYFTLELKSHALTSALPVVYIKKYSDRLLTVSYFHGGVRSMITRTVAFERLSRQQYDADEIIAR